MKTSDVALYQPHFPRIVSNDARHFRLKDEIYKYLQAHANTNLNTLRARTYDLQSFLLYMEVHFEEPLLGDVNDGYVESWKCELLHGGESPTTVMRRIAIVKAFFRALSEVYPGFVSPARKVTAPHVTPGKPKALNATEEVALRSHLYDKRNLGYREARNYALVETCLEVGFRTEELVRLTEANIGSDMTSFTQVWGKANRFRDKAISERLASVLEWYLPRRTLAVKEWAFKRRLHKLDPRALPLFLSFHDAVPEVVESFRMSPKTIYRIVTGACREASIDHHPTHHLRHTLGTKLADATGDPALVCEALGHSDVKMTMRYITRGIDRIREEMNKMNRATSGGQS